MSIIAFDSKDCERRRIVQDINPETQEPYITQETTFFSPLGVGVKFKDSTDFRQKCLETFQEFVQEFDVKEKRILYDSYSLKNELSHRVATPFCDKLIHKLSNHIDSIFITYVILPPDEFPTLEVGGFKCPTTIIKNAHFLRALAPMFSHITTWSYFGLHSYNGEEVHLDSFNSKQTFAWEELSSVLAPKIFPHGDECNPYIAIADIIAYLTDSKLYNYKKKLNSEDIKKVWEGYGFNVESRYLDINQVSKYRWHSDDEIMVDSYLAHPMTFLLVDELDKLQPDTSNIADEETVEATLDNAANEKRFRKLVRRMEPWYAVTAYAYNKGGGAQLFNYYMDKDKVKDGDTMVYIGNKSKEMAQSFCDWLEIDVLSAKDVRKTVNRLKA